MVQTGPCSAAFARPAASGMLVKGGPCSSVVARPATRRQHGHCVFALAACTLFCACTSTPDSAACTLFVRVHCSCRLPTVLNTHCTAHCTEQLDLDSIRLLSAACPPAAARRCPESSSAAGNCVPVQHVQVHARCLAAPGGRRAAAGQPGRHAVAQGWSIGA